MSQYPEPPSDPQSHYAAIYPAAPPAPMVEPGQQDQLPYHLSQPQQGIYPKLEPSLTPGPPPGHANHASNASPIEARAAAALAQQHQDGHTPKTNRLRKACDSCSIRKVKCDESGPPCRACAALDIPCTFDRPSRRRGPPNRHAEAIKKRRLEENGPSSPNSPTHAAQALAALSSVPTFTAESICPLDTLQLLINDFFTYIHPLCPFPHEPTFREMWSRREDITNRPFLALLAAMVATLVASFPRKARLDLKAQQREKLFPTHMALVNRCIQVCTAARGGGYLDRPDLDVYDACTSYFLGLTGAYTFKWRQCRLYFGESLTILRVLGLHKAQSEPAYAELLSGASNGPPYQGQPIMDKITEQIGRRLFWTTFVGMRTLQQNGASFGEVTFVPPTPSEQYPEFPAEVDDTYIYPSYIDEQPKEIVPLMSGFIANCRIYSSYQALSTMELAYGIGEVLDWEKQKRVLDQCLKNCKAVLDELATELKVWPAGDQFGHPQPGYYPPLSDEAALHGQPGNLFDLDSNPEERRRVQYEIQKANIYASHLSTRSYIVEKYFAMSEAYSKMKSQEGIQETPGMISAGLDAMLEGNKPPTEFGDSTEQEMAEEREQIIKDLLIVLGSINQVNMEPNGDSFTVKIRQIASTLLDVPKTRKGSFALQAEQYLIRFLDILSKLERSSPSNMKQGIMPDEEEELRHWADLREYQMKFQQAGGVFGLL